ncbi:hypothetical protein SLA2020_077260 [Shorea laevis]
MVLGLSAKSRRGPTVQVDYLIHIQEIKPWPPSQSLRSLRSVLIQWENGERNLGSTNTVVPSIGSVVGEGKIEFNESFKLPVTLVKELSVKGRDADVFQKNILELNLYERRRDKNQLLATAIVDLADYGILKESLSTSVSMNCKRTFNNTSQPVLFFKIQPIDKGRTGPSEGRLLKGASLDKNGSESVSDLMNEEYAEEADSASFTDDDVSSHSSLTVSSSLQNGFTAVMDSKGGVTREHASTSKSQLEKSNVRTQMTACENAKGSSSCSSSVDFSSDHESHVDSHVLISNSHDSSFPISNNGLSHDSHFSASSFASKSTEEEANISMRSNDSKKLTQEVHKMVSNDETAVNSYSKENASGSSLAKEAPSANNSQTLQNFDAKAFNDSMVHGEEYGKTWKDGKNSSEEASASVGICNNSMGNMDGNSWQENDCDKDQLSTIYSQDTFSSGQGNLGTTANVLRSDRLKHVKSVRSSSDSARSIGLFSTKQHAEVRDIGPLRGNERKDANVYPKDTRGATLDSKIQQLEQKIKLLEGELREAAAIEAALYSVVAEHGSSVSKMHAPARRLSRLYLHSCREGLKSRKASAARSSVSGLVLAAKACGNDVPRLTFWLSNSVVLRAIINQSTGESGLRLCAGPMEKIGGGKGKEASSPLKWIDSSSYKNENRSLSHKSFSDWDDPHTFTSALEKIEAWIFSRIVESVWWQTLTPHMQLAVRKSTDKSASFDSRKNHGRTSSLCYQDQVNFSLDHWKMAFKDACERLCPVRAEGHDCGCLPMLARLIMEQCVARLDVAMFNAILRDSDDDIPTDPVSDPISDSMVLPIAVGKTSFGTGAQLKNAIGNWSRWLTDLFGIDNDDSLEDENDNCEGDGRQDTSSKCFHLLNALSDLMMLPKDMLLSAPVRKEVCPTFGAPLIKRVLDNFVPDEFCSDPVPDVVLEALDVEDPAEAREGSVTNFPCPAAPPVYTAPSASSVASIIGEGGAQPQLRKSGSSVLRKSYTSDDELDELSSPLASIFNDTFRSVSVPSKPSWISQGNGYQNAIRYELLRDVWFE